MEEQHSPGSLLTRTRQLLCACPKSIPVLHQETGLPFYWLAQFRSGKTKDPSVNRVQALYEHLTGKQLEVQ